MSETIYYQRSRNIIQNKTKDYYKNDKERLRYNARKNKNKKIKKRECGRNRYHNMSKEK